MINHDNLSITSVQKNLNSKGLSFFKHIARLTNFKPDKGITIIPVIHCSEGSLPLINALDYLFHLPILILKDSTKKINHHLIKELKKKGFNINKLYTKEYLGNSINALKMIEKNVPKNNKFLIMDHGGYYFSAINLLLKKYTQDKFIGITEHTLNGHIKYEKEIAKYNSKIPIVSIAKTHIKSIVDMDISDTIAHAVDHIIRQATGIKINNISTFTVGIIGYGSLGMGVAKTLKEKMVQNIKIAEIDPTRSIRAIVDGFILEDINTICSNCNVIISATGRMAIKSGHFNLMQNNTFISTVTSPDDELDLDNIISERILLPENEKELFSTYKVKSTNKEIHLLLNGKASNLLMRVCISFPALIFLSEAMQIISNLLLILNKNNVALGKVIDLNQQYQDIVSNTWLAHFGKAEQAGDSKQSNILHLRESNITNEMIA